MATEAPATSTPVGTPRKRGGGLRFLVFLVFAVLAVAGTGGYLWWRAGRGPETDDAFVKADVVSVSADVAGRVVAIPVVENQRVHAGDVLVQLDDTDAKLALAQAEAAYAAAQADEKRAEDAVAAAGSGVKLAQVKQADAAHDVETQTKLLEAGAVTRESATKTQTGAQVAVVGVKSARDQVAVALSAVEAARAHAEQTKVAVDQAQRNLDLTVVRAPIDGIVTRIDAAIGELAQRGAPLMALVPTDIYVTANFKETDLADIHIGAPVEVTLDAWPSHELKGEVESIGAGTGAAFSLLPADNASGNFIKVVQRVPIRVHLDETTVDGQPIPLGLSATVHVLPGQPAATATASQAGPGEG